MKAVKRWSRGGQKLCQLPRGRRRPHTRGRNGPTRGQPAVKNAVAEAEGQKNTKQADGPLVTCLKYESDIFFQDGWVAHRRAGEGPPGPGPGQAGEDAPREPGPGLAWPGPTGPGPAAAGSGSGQHDCPQVGRQASLTSVGL